MIHSREYFEVNPLNKNLDWARRLMRHYYQYWIPVVPADRYLENLSYILSAYDMSTYESMFKDPKNIGFDFIPIAVLEKVRNVLWGERLQAGVEATCRATDPASENERTSDRKILETRKEFETLMSFLQTSIGLPEYRLKDEKGPNNPYKGNMEAFDELGLNEKSKKDVSYFFRIHHKLLHEMDATEIANAYLEYNKIKDHLENWCNDIAAVKALAGQVYVDQVSGAIKYNYFRPHEVYHIPGESNDSTTSPCKGFLKNVTVMELMRRMGDDFNFNEHINYLVDSVNFHNGTGFVQITENGAPIWNRGIGIEGPACEWENFTQFKVGIGYMEFQTIDASTYKVGKDFAGNTGIYKIDYSVPVEENTPYKKEVRHRFTTYKAYFFSTSSADLVPFKFGKLYHQIIEGAEDEISQGSIFFKVLQGVSIAEASQPWINIGVELFYKMKWMVRKAKPKGRSYNYESLVKMAKHMIKEGSLKEKVTQMIRMFEEGINEIYTLPEVAGEKMGGGQQVHFDLPNGLDATAINFKALLEWVFQMIASDIGLNDVRTAETMAPNSGFKLQMQSMAQSRNATEYLNYLIDWKATEITRRMVLTSQDIIRYKTTQPYRFMCNLVGENVAERMSLLEDKAHHRYAIWMYTLSTYNERQEIKAQTYEAYNKGQIPFEVLLLINEQKDYKKAAFILSYEKKRAEQEKFLLEQQRHDNVMAEKQAEAEGKIREIQEKSKGDVAVEKAKGYFQVILAEKNNQAKAELAENKQQHKPVEMEKKTEEATKLAANKATIDSAHPD